MSDRESVLSQQIVAAWDREFTRATISTVDYAMARIAARVALESAAAENVRLRAVTDGLAAFARADGRMMTDEQFHKEISVLIRTAALATAEEGGTDNDA